MIVLEATEPGSPPLDGPARECKFAAMLVESHRDGFSDAGSIPAASTTRLSLDAIRVPGSFCLLKSTFRAPVFFRIVSVKL